MGEWRRIDPGRDYFLYGISYAYLIQLAFFTGRSDLVTDEMVERMITPFPRLEATSGGRANRPYPFSYVLNVLGELGLAGLLYAPHAAYGGRSPFDWVVEHLSPGGGAESAPALHARPRADRLVTASSVAKCAGTRAVWALRVGLTGG